MLSRECFDKVSIMEWRSGLDIGCGINQIHSAEFRKLGRNVTTLDIIGSPDILADINLFKSADQFDMIWLSHVLEHQLNVNKFLAKCSDLLSDDGVLAITVPPMKSEIVGGHVTLWNSGLLCYNLILAGFDLSAAKVWTYGYNISLIVRKKAAYLPPLNYDCGDIELLSQFFPSPVKQGFNGSNYERR
jgi:SAM-dependent methyltransferase